MKIFETYKQTEKSLLLKFRQASQENNIQQMQTMADTLSSYQHYQHCVDAFIEQAVHQLTEQERRTYVNILVHSNWWSFYAFNDLFWGGFSFKGGQTLNSDPEGSTVNSDLL